MKPEVSVIVTVKDGMPFVEAALEAVLAQTFSNFELIVVDDASTDATPEVLARLAQRDGRVRILTLMENLRQARAANEGLKMARGQFIARTDADDLVVPHWLEREIEYLKAHRDVDIVGASMRHVNSDGTFIRDNPKSETPFQVRWITRFRWPFAHNTIMFRRQGRDGEAWFYDPSFRYADDYDFCARIVAEGNGRNLPDILISYRAHDGSLSSSKWREQQREAGRVGRWLQERDFPPDIYEKLKAFRSAYYDFEPRPARDILKGLKRAVKVELPEGKAEYRWMCREAIVLYYLAMRRNGQGRIKTSLAAALFAPGLLFNAVLDQISRRKPPRPTSS